MSTPTPTLQAKLDQVNARINRAAGAVSRDPAGICLVAVSKTYPVQAVLDALDAGQTQFGENYAAEGVSKIEQLRAARPQATVQWHFIGPIQSNKTRLIAAHYDWVQSIDRLKIAQRLSEQRPADAADLNVLIQVNISAEPSKSGVAPDALADLAREVTELPRLRLRGLMAIPQATAHEPQQRKAFTDMQVLFEATRAVGGPYWDTLSMGMSADLEAAIAAGSTMVRVGRAIFGERT